MLALQTCLEVGDFSVLAVGVGFAAFVVDGEGGLSALEEGLLPVVEQGDGDAVLFADIGNRDFVEKVLPEHGTFRQLTNMPWIYFRFYKNYFQNVRFKVVPLNFPPAGVYFCKGYKGPKAA